MNMLRNRQASTPTSTGGASNLSASYGGFDSPSPSSSSAYGGYSGGASHSGSSSGSNGYNYGYSNGNGYSGNGYSGNGYSSNGSASVPPTPPQSSSPRISPRNKRRGSYQRGETSLPAFLHNPAVALGLLACVVFFAGFTVRYRSNVNFVLKNLKASSIQQAMDIFKKMEKDRNHWQRQVDVTRRDLNRASSQKISKLEADMRSLTAERDTLKNALEGPERKAEEDRRSQREQAWIDQVRLLQEATRKESRRNVIEKFGPGPTYQVRIWYLIPGDTREHDFVIETAELDLVPHAIHLFLEQVDHGLWVNCYFYLNGPHVLQAGPQAEELHDENGNVIEQTQAESARAIQPFTDKGLETLAFPDYNSKFPHVTWSVGFTGRPGGPDFYINKVDNVKAHGPGGQSQHVLEEQGDPCFGRITLGQNNVARLYQQKVFGDGSEWTWFLKDPVKITRAYVEKPEPATQEQHHEQQHHEQQHQEHHEQQQQTAHQENHDHFKRRPRIPEHQVEP